MPRYFVHTLSQDQLAWNTTGLELPEVAEREDRELTWAIWSEVFDQQIQRSRTFVITDENGELVFATSF
ncbi:hypothetical protein JKG68_32075 [Microvirga aerilata]|uniref:Uncharacterized protein n=1 Tax=Microvirga aerilata TaxID=670292 RepID=A0A936ZE07_9HYPH|nr:hypothetical protein [Microvirga aerilata]MBL0408502.1 hypothetical protein [Microvirga aerilata]